MRRILIILLLLIQNIPCFTQTIIKTNLLSTVSLKPEISLTTEHRFKNEKGIFLTLSKTIDLHDRLLNKSILQNYFHHSFQKNKTNLEVEFGYYLTKTFGLGLSYGNISILKREKYCENASPFTEDMLVLECESFLDMDYNSTTHIAGLHTYKTFPLFNVKSFVSSLVLSGQFQYIWNNDPIYNLQQIDPSIREVNNSGIVFYNANLSYKKSSFYFIPKIELHVGYKI